MQEKHLSIFCLSLFPTGDLAHNPGMCHDWESNWRPLGSQANTQSTEPDQPGHDGILFRPKMEWSTGTGYNMDEPGKHNAW